MAPLHFERSRTYPVDVAVAYQRTISMPLPKLFRHRYGPVPPIAEVRDQAGKWNSVGETRTIVLKGGGSMREELVEVDRPNVFRYVLSDIKGPMKPLVDHVEGSWSFDPVGTGTRVTWAWEVHPRSGASVPALKVFRRFWSGSARRALEVLEGRLLR